MTAITMTERRPRVSRWAIWRRWVVANIVGEAAGCGLAMLIGLAAARAIGQATGMLQAAPMIGAVLLVGMVEGAAVGLAQWQALRTALPSITRRAWLLATVAGAILAWGAGMTIGALAGDQLETIAGDSPWPAAAVIGLVAGTLLSVCQWLALRRAAPGARWWTAVHAGAWSLGMLVAFAGMSAIAEDTPVALNLLIGAVTGLAMGLVVAALSGLALVALVAAADPTAGRGGHATGVGR